MPSIKVEDAMDEVYEDEAIQEEVSWVCDDEADRREGKELKAAYLADFFNVMGDLVLKQTPPGEYDDFDVPIK